MQKALNRPVVPKNASLFVLIPFFLYGFAFGVGTNFAGDWYYPISGIGILDMLLALHFLLLLLLNYQGFALQALRKETIFLASLIFALITWLLLSVLANITYGFETRDVLAILRLLYFIIIIVMVSRHVEHFGYIHVILGYLLGVATIFSQDYFNIPAENAVFFGIPVLSNPNVVGVALGLAVYFCSLGVIADKAKLFFPLALIFSALSITTFSKGSWLLVILGLIANLLALKLIKKDRGGYSENKNVVKKYIVLFLIAIGAIYYLYGEIIISLINFKLDSTEDVGSFQIRTNLLLVAAYAAIENPFFGLGYGNFYNVQILYPGIPIPPLLREDNAHNVFGQIAATGGIPALILLIAIIAFTGLRLRRAMRNHCGGSSLRRSAYLLVSLTIVILFGSVQLQLIAQPVFWFFSALVIGWCHSLNPGQHHRQS